MAVTTGTWIVIAAIAAVVLIAVVLLAWTATRRRRSLEAQSIRKHIQAETTRVEKRQALADETGTKARAAQAEAEAKAAEASRLQQRSVAHHEQAATSRDELRQQSERAASLDPDTRGEARTDPPSTT